jgi:hypothetical protein
VDIYVFLPPDSIPKQRFGDQTAVATPQIITASFQKASSGIEVLRITSE